MSFWSRFWQQAERSEPSETKPDPKVMDRAQFLRSGFQRLGQSAGMLAGHVVDRIATPRLRPPGALEELAFLTTCTRCGACATKCPTRSILLAGHDARLAVGTPYLDPAQQPCHLCPDMPCIEACEPEALIPVAPKEVRIGLAVVDRERCLMWNGDPCDRCLKYCPYPGDALLADPETGRIYVDPRHCTGCGQCTFHCPTAPASIVVHPI